MAHRTIKDKIALSKKICDDYGSNNATIESCCGEHGITHRTFMYWVNEFSEISDIYKIAKEKNTKIAKDGMREKALNALQRFLTGWNVEETETEEMKNGKGKVVMTKTKKKNKFIPPSTTAMIFALKNIDPTNWNEDMTIDFGGEKQVFKIGDQTIEFK
jgi:hypothetical protein